MKSLRTTVALSLLTGLALAQTPSQGPARSGFGPVLRTPPSPCDQGADSSDLPPDFAETFVGTDWIQPVGIAFDSVGRGYVWEKSGSVWLLEDGVKSAEPLIDLTEEVGDWESHGLKGFALDPDFYVNGHIYLLYAVDKHHVLYFGTPSYDPEADQFWENTIGRLTRYTATAASGFTQVDPASRKVLIGETMSSGFPICGIHGIGSLVFFDDGTLAVSCGDGNQDGMPGTSCLADGVITLKEEVNSRRSQLLDSLSGKVLRVDPATGDGLPDNPWYEASAPASARSRVWAMGLRNPYRMTLRGGGSAGQGPGTLLIGDVGGAEWEELNICQGGENFGWPMYQGMAAEVSTLAEPQENLDAPNPLYQQTIPGVGLCDRPFFYFQELLAEDSLNPYSWPNPCDPSQEVPATIPHHSHTRPELTWLHFTGPALVPTFDGSGEAASEELGTAGSPVAGDSFAGNCSIAGAWYGSGSFPPDYHETYFHADYGARWIRNLIFDDFNNLIEVREFAPTAGAVVGMAIDPVRGDLYYIDLENPDENPVRRIAFSTDNQPPLASFTSSANYGPVPLEVAFDATSSIDPEGKALTYSWDFGDGSPPKTGANVTHTFPTLDKTPAGTIVSKLDELDPPVPMGLGSLDPEVIRDGVYPLLDSTYPLVQFDTWHFNPLTLLPDKGEDDWIGYTYSGEHEFRGLLFQEGVRWPGLVGGWFLFPTVQVRDAATGAWNEVTGLTFTPHYPLPAEPNGAVSFQIFEVDFDPVVGDGVRLFGIPGGTIDFVSVAELRVLTTGNEVTEPTNYTVTLLVTDEAGKTDCSTEVISVNNTPPTVQITSPVSGTAIDVSQPVTLPFFASFSDPEHLTGDCEWQVTLVHDNHTHPEPPDTACVTAGTFLAHPMDPGDVLYWRVDMTLTDPLGLSHTDTALLYLDNDCNFNGVDDAVDIAQGTSLDANLNGRPDECEADCNGNGIHDLLDVVSGLSADVNQDGIPDECP
ncbi:MAG: PQQ-dependent sugar dehydrogenase [Planctomycetota bacterium]